MEMAETGESKTPIQHLIAEVLKNPNYKVLTKDEYTILVNGSLKHENTSTPVVKPNMSPMTKLLNAIKLSKYFFSTNLYDQ